jgi:hypothetical protein
MVGGNKFQCAMETLKSTEWKIERLPAGSPSRQGGGENEYETPLWPHRQKLAFHTLGEFKLGPPPGEFCPLCHFIFDNMVRKKRGVSDIASTLSPDCLLLYSVEYAEHRLAARLFIGTAEAVLTHIYLSLPASTSSYI